MSKLDELVAIYQIEAKKLGISITDSLLKSVAKGLGPALYNVDSSLVSCSDTTEKERVRENFLKKKLGLSDDGSLDKAIDEVCATFGSSNKNKYRALFYAVLVMKYKKESVYA